MLKFKIDTLILPHQAKMLGHELATLKGVASVDIDRKRNTLSVEGECLLCDIFDAAARHGIIITPV